MYSVEQETGLRSAADSLKLERSKRRETEAKLTQLEDEISELRENNSSLNKVRNIYYITAYVCVVVLVCCVSGGEVQSKTVELLLTGHCVI